MELIARYLEIVRNDPMLLKGWIFLGGMLVGICFTLFGILVIKYSDGYEKKQ